MIGSVSLEMIRLAVFAGNKLGIKELVLFVVLLATSNKIKLHPIFWIVIAGAIGGIAAF